MAVTSNDLHWLQLTLFMVFTWTSYVYRLFYILITCMTLFNPFDWTWFSFYNRSSLIMLCVCLYFNYLYDLAYLAFLDGMFSFKRSYIVSSDCMCVHVWEYTCACAYVCIYTFYLIHMYICICIQLYVCTCHVCICPWRYISSKITCDASFIQYDMSIVLLQLAMFIILVWPIMLLWL